MSKDWISFIWQKRTSKIKSEGGQSNRPKQSDKERRKREIKRNTTTATYILYSIRPWSWVTDLPWIGPTTIEEVSEWGSEFLLAGRSYRDCFFLLFGILLLRIGCCLLLLLFFFIILILKETINILCMRRDIKLFTDKQTILCLWFFCCYENEKKR